MHFSRSMIRTAAVLGLSVAGCAVVQAADDGAASSSDGKAKSQSPEKQAMQALVSFSSDNPFAHPSELPFHAPNFKKIHDSDFMPAIEAGMQRQIQAIHKIANNDAAPTFDNTIVAMEKTGQLLDRTLQVFFGLTGANTDDRLQHVQRIEAPRLAAHQDAIYLNDQLFQRVATLHKKRDSLNLDPESARLLNKYYKEFVHAGAKLSQSDKTKLKSLNKRLSSLSTTFTQKLLAANSDHSPIFVNKDSLAGLSDAQIKNAGDAAASRHLVKQWLISLQNTTQQPQLADMRDRGARENLYSASWNRAEHGGDDDTRNTIETMAMLRADKAKLMGYDNYAGYKLYNQMAKTPKKALGFMHKLVGPAKASAKAEAADLQKLIKQSGHDFQLRPWDWQYYAAKLRKKRFNIDESEVKPYFKLDNVLKKGVFYAAHKLYGISFKERDDLPVWNPSVRTFTVYDADGSKLGLFYADYFKRDNKRGGAWMSNFVGQSKLLGNKPVIYNVTNFPKPPKGQPALLSYEQVTTMFHEFGHALNGLFADTKYPMLSGTATPRDFVEFPSQFNEHWAIYPEVFKHYAVNYKTGKPMPEALKKKVMKSVHFNQGYDMGELISAALLDMAWHTIGADAPKKQADQFQRAALKNAGMYMPNLVPPRYSSSYFQHIWGNGYAAGYYAYLWTEMLADDGYAWFKEHGGLTRANGDRFRKMVLSKGDTENLQKVYDHWRGRPPKIGPMLKNRGLTGHGGNGNGHNQSSNQGPNQGHSGQSDDNERDNNESDDNGGNSSGGVSGSR